MGQDMVVPTDNIPASGFDLVVPALIADLGPDAAERFIEFFAATIRNANTREAYGRAVRSFFHWCERSTWARRAGIQDLKKIRPVDVAAYIEELGQHRAKATVKQHLAALRHLFDWLVTGQIVRVNPTASVRGPKIVQATGQTPILTEPAAKHLIETIGTERLVDLRDRALISQYIYSFGRVSATLAMDVRDVLSNYQGSRRTWIRLHEKGGKTLELPCNHKLEERLWAYIEAAGITDESKAPLYRAVDRKTKALGEKRLTRQRALDMIKRRCRQAGLPETIGNHSFRGTGITNYLEQQGARIEYAQKMAGHSSIKTTQVYDRRGDKVSLDEVERITI